MTLVLGTVDIEDYVNYNGIVKIDKLTIVEHKFPAATTSKFQNMGGESTKWQLVGIIAGTDEDADIATLQGYYDNFTTVSYQDNDGTRDVKVLDFQTRDLITFHEFTMTLGEV